MRPSRWALAAAAVLLLLAPSALACDDPDDTPPYAELQVQEADGSVRVAWPTAAPYPPCSAAPQAAFAGRWAAYRDASGGVRVLDWRSGADWSGSGGLPSRVTRGEAFRVVNDTFVTLETEGASPAYGQARWRDLVTGEEGVTFGLDGFELFGGMAVSVREAALQAHDVRRDQRVAAIPLESLGIRDLRVIDANAAYTAIWEPDGGRVGLVHHATGAVDWLATYANATGGYLDDGHLLLTVGPGPFGSTAWWDVPDALYRVPFEAGAPHQVVHAEGALRGHSKGLYLAMAHGMPPASSSETPPLARTATATRGPPTDGGDGDEVIEIPFPGLALAAAGLLWAARRRRA